MKLMKLTSIELNKITSIEHKQLVMVFLFHQILYYPIGKY